jgi:zinc/manganese transport system ATP-binding protein
MPIVNVHQATVRYGVRTVFDALDLEVDKGEFLAVLGPNGAGKTTLLKMLLGLTRPSSGTIEIAGKPAGRANRDIGYVPQQHAFDQMLPIRGRDLVQFGLDGHRAGFPFTSRRTRTVVDAAIRAVGAEHYANAPIGRLSGGEQQRLRIAQALVTDPKLLLCDEPLLSLDLAQQRVVSELINERRRTAGTAVLFVTHDINPVLPYVDRVLYLVEGRWAIGSAQEVFTSARLTELYGTEVEVIDVRGRIVVIGSDEPGLTEAHAHHHHSHEPARSRWL